MTFINLFPHSQSHRSLSGAFWLAVVWMAVSIAHAAAPAQQAYFKASNTGVNDQFGWATAVFGDTMVVGARSEQSAAFVVNGNQGDNSANQAGAVYVFVRNGTNWTQQAYIKAHNAGAGDGFGYSVAIYSNTVVVGAYFESGSGTGVNPANNNSAFYAGAAYVFVRSGTNWTQQAYLKASNTGMADLFGVRVAVSGDTIVVGAMGEDSAATGVNGAQGDSSASGAGAAYIFVRSGTNWAQQAYLKASNAGVDDNFGAGVAITGDTVVIGAPGESSNATGVNSNPLNNAAFLAGAAYVFVRSGTNWTQQAYLKASNTAPNDYLSDDRFGNSVAVSGDTIVVGAWGEDGNATGVNGNQNDSSALDAGAAYVFVRKGANWTQQAYLKASNTSEGDLFGEAVAISGDTAVIGAASEDSNASGMNGNQNDESSFGAGAAYVFIRRGTNWTQQAYLKASNNGSEDYFGRSVALHGETVAVGADLEDSNATGINGSQANNNTGNSGATYVFTGLGIGPTLTLGTNGSGGRLLRLEGHSGLSYRWLRATNVLGPWVGVATNIVPASGLLEYLDTNLPSARAFYRVAQP